MSHIEPVARVSTDTRSHVSHAMNPIDGAFYEAEDWGLPDPWHTFKCMFCGALDQTPKAGAPCSWGNSDDHSVR